MENTTRPTTDLDWTTVQADLRANVYGDWQTIRHALCVIEGDRNPGEGIGSSDVNHMAFGWVRSGADFAGLVSEAGLTVAEPERAPEPERGGFTIDTPEGIAAWRDLSAYHALKLDVETGLHVYRGSIYAHVKRTYGLRGSKASVLAQFGTLLREQGILSTPSVTIAHEA